MSLLPADRPTILVVDGHGYPDALGGEAIPLSARLMAVADVYDAMRSPRPYKPAFSHEQAVTFIGERGRRFDPEVVTAFEALAEEIGEIADRLADP